MAATVYIALGSNLGDRRDFLDRALADLRGRPGVEVTRVSSVYETAPVGGPAGQEPYLNAVAELRTTLAPAAVLQLLLDVESRLGRVRAERDGPRTIDLDLLLYDDVVRDDTKLMLPHPRLHQRLFVLQPLAEIAPGLIHPLLKRTIADLLGDLLQLRPFGVSPGRELTGLRALVTGSTSGIGLAVALELASAGADVIVHGRRSLEAAEETASQVRGAGGRSAVLLADLRDRAECQRLADNAWEVWKGLDVCVNNAGTDTLTGEAASWPFERKLQELLAVDVTATMLLSRAVGRRMKESGGGVVINMGWDQADVGMESDSGELFAAAKGAVMAFSKSLALSLAPEVRVHCLAPGWIRTSWGHKASEAWQDRVMRETPLRRWGLPEDVAATARWLASPAARYLTGQVIRVNGGAVR
ncbi:MAG TPA: 2-amino-4-hydroxy-6-hydroxymethyldihydropteridine diphosphokinase [Planctomycetales bacterium]|jgi:2-amino-4-hydroxy-6-hydroxymethyldihydropteridine diphosphokinase|nr:2-amino-4-hydroxy-6-hydroxymethyldihydropteridine diphosphokinase [Planctomycetales bacterium]